MGVSKYDQKIMKTETGQQLYSRWLNLRKKEDCCDDFKDFMKFYKWAMKSGFRYGLTLRRYDNDEPYGPDNCYWVDIGAKHADSYKRRADVSTSIERFNDTVNKIRKACGMEPLRTSSEETPNDKGE